MPNVSEVIEIYIKKLLQQSPEGQIEIQRNELADKFNCVPSQINYVLGTRFTLEKGYIVESKRGGGGYIRIQKVEMKSHGSIHQHISKTISKYIDQNTAEGLIYQLEEAGLISEREARIMKAAICREVLAFKLPFRDEIRATLLKSMLLALLTK